MTPPVDPTALTDDIGLSLDMLDADRLREWAQLLLVHGADISHWGSVPFVASKMQTLATDIEKAVRDIGTLRALASPATPATEGQTDSEVLKLFEDHSVALEFVREMSAQPCPHDCAGDCLKCRAKAWLYTPRAEGQGHAATPAGEAITQFVAADGRTLDAYDPPKWIMEAADAFAAGRISAGKLAELLGSSDIHAFKQQAHSFCDAPPAALDRLRGGVESAPLDDPTPRYYSVSPPPALDREALVRAKAEAEAERDAARAALAEANANISLYHHWLACCYRESGADPDGNEDWRLAPDALNAVKELRADYDEAGKENETLRAQLLTAKAEGAREALEQAAEDAQTRWDSECARGYGGDPTWGDVALWLRTRVQEGR